MFPLDFASKNRKYLHVQCSRLLRRNELIHTLSCFEYTHKNVHLYKLMLTACCYLYMYVDPHAALGYIIYLYM